MILMMIVLTMTMTIMMMMDIYIYIYGYTDKLSIYLSINKPASLYPMYHRKKHLNPTLDTPAVALRKVL